MNDDATYICDACGEEIVVPIDLSQGTSQDYVEDCPVCCRANVIHVEVGDDGDAFLGISRSGPEEVFKIIKHKQDLALRLL